MYFNTVDLAIIGPALKQHRRIISVNNLLNLICAESATLIGLLKATSSYNPLTNKKRSLKRRKS
ncbi:MAG: hypothetical protein R2847_10080 [Bacteroidia bacterium]